MTQSTPAKLRADWIFTGDTLLRDAIISFQSDSDPRGEFEGNGTLLEVRPYDPEKDHSYQHLKERLIIPGILNAHSHAFQRAIRGRTHAIDIMPDPQNAPHDNFWSWRTQMYRAANALNEEEIFAVSRVAFLEMLRAGYTSVGEFHYLQRPSGSASTNDTFADYVIAAARDVGIRITLIQTAYKESAPGLPATPEQHRFTYDSIDELLEATLALHQRYTSDPLVSIAVAAHSIRAVDSDGIRRCHEFAVEHDLPFHIHACEQRKELEQCREKFGVEPIEYIDSLGALTERTSIIHGTHLAPGDIERLSRSGAIVVACPTTERDLGDGFLPATDLLSAGIPVAIGTDSQATIDPFEEIRCIEYHERLLREARNVTANVLHVRQLAERLFAYCQEGGDRSLRCKRGFLRESYAPDFVSINLNHPILWGVTEDPTLDTRLGIMIATLILSGDTSLIDRVWVGGIERRERLLGDYQDECRDAYERALALL